MKVPKGCSLRLDSAADPFELQITAAITTRSQASELIAAIKQFAGVLQGDKRPRGNSRARGANAAGASATADADA